MMAPSMLDKIKRTTQQCLDGYDKFDMEAIMACRSDDCKYYTLPESFGIPPRNNAEYREYFSTTVLPLFKNFKTEIVDAAYDADARKAALHGFSMADAPFGAYRMEICIFLDFDESGEKIVVMKEMLDSAALAGYYQKIGELQARQETPSAAPSV